MRRLYTLPFRFVSCGDAHARVLCLWFARQRLNISPTYSNRSLSTPNLPSTYFFSINLYVDLSSCSSALLCLCYHLAWRRKNMAKTAHFYYQFMTFKRDNYLSLLPFNNHTWFIFSSVWFTYGRRTFCWIGSVGGRFPFVLFYPSSTFERCGRNKHRRGCLPPMADEHAFWRRRVRDRRWRGAFVACARCRRFRGKLSPLPYHHSATAYRRRRRHARLLPFAAAYHPPLPPTYSAAYLPTGCRGSARTCAPATLPQPSWWTLLYRILRCALRVILLRCALRAHAHALLAATAHALYRCLHIRTVPPRCLPLPAAAFKARTMLPCDMHVGTVGSIRYYTAFLSAACFGHALYALLPRRALPARGARATPAIPATPPFPHTHHCCGWT